MKGAAEGKIQQDSSRTLILSCSALTNAMRNKTQKIGLALLEKKGLSAVSGRCPESVVELEKTLCTADSEALPPDCGH